MPHSVYCISVYDMPYCHLATDAAEVNRRITGRVTDTNDHHSLVSVAICVSDQ